MTQLTYQDEESMGEDNSHLPTAPTTSNYHPSKDELQYYDTSNQTLTTSSPGLYPQFLLFGDSITQAATLTLQASLQTLYVRRLDILNRGFGGYNTSLALKTIPHFLPINTPPPSPLSLIPEIKLAFVFFGANDACIPIFDQHVPINLFVSNLKRIISYPVFQRHGTKVILITTPPIDEYQFLSGLTRTAKLAAKYALAVRQLAKESNTPCVDIWASFIKAAGYTPPSLEHIPEDLSKLPGSLKAPQSSVLGELLIDGLHFTPKGYDLMFKELMNVIRDQIPECLPEHLPIIFKEWKQILRVGQEDSVSLQQSSNQVAPPLP